MAEEGQNLKRIMEEGITSEKIEEVSSANSQATDVVTKTPAEEPDRATTKPKTQRKKKPQT